MSIQGLIRPAGALQASVKQPRKAPLVWRVKNTMRRHFLWGWLVAQLARWFSKGTGIATITSELSIRAHLHGEWIDYGPVSYRVVTDAGVTFLRDDWNSGANDINTMNFHGCGTGAVAEAVGDTALGTESTTALNPDNTRATGTRSVPAANQYRSVGTLTFDATAAVTEHGLFSTSGTGTGTLWDRSVFSAINVASADSIQFTYTVTLTSGG